MTAELFIKMVLDTWNTKIGRTDKLLAQLSDEQLQKEIAPGKNRGVYLLGHLAGINNRLLPLLDLGKDPKPELYETFVAKSDKEVTEFPPVSDLRKEWTTINSILSEKFAQMRPEEWFQKHTSVSAEDFANEPHRNKLNVIINRTNHLDYHLGQLVLLS